MSKNKCRKWFVNLKQVFLLKHLGLLIVLWVFSRSAPAFIVIVASLGQHAVKLAMQAQITQFLLDLTQILR